MIPLPAHTVNIVLQYISPPSQLAQPLPPHLVSKPLLQRHHYLQIFPSVPQEYLCWPAPHSARAIELLESCNGQPVDDQADAYPTRYTFDGEYVYAHVHISSDREGVRMLFQWDEADGWKYHDLQLMPFPVPSYSSIEEVTAPPSIRSEYSEGARTFELEDARGGSDESDDDAYWNAYDAPGDEYSPLPPHSAKKSAHEGAEDAYWAQYASVQGSGDSTLPSPLPNARKLQPAANPARLAPQDEPIPISLSAIHSRSLTSKLDPPSPNTLTHLLNFISPRRDVYSPSLDEPASAFTSDTPSPFSTVDNSDLVTPLSADGGQIAQVVSPVAVKLNGVPYLTIDNADNALSDTIKGIYHLWKAGRRKLSSDEEESTSFLRIVREAITDI
ncbi:hypothetical protein BV22DRAFT_1053633 [Leucogyrophana mollusca]|uniref:Uncharacterized protein n=1 Tax=Leucogyrophana mollusca TaxID=85980 RepID=A0ACB8BZP1_9AGAM|nr:hypothetical protein BV22DRAFT_1053633 [Leucogyrophana mollusca]